jgi:drug/metabolite transporter (DMT)-like permease
MSRNLTGTLLVLLAAAGYAFFSIFSKMAIAAGVQPFDLAVWRFVLAAAIFWAAFPVWRKQAGLAGVTRRDLTHMLLLGVLFSAVALTAFIGLNTALSASAFTLLTNSAPVVVALLSVAFGERLSRATWLAVALATVGSVMILNAQLAVEGIDDLIWPILNTILIAVYLVWAQHTTGHISGLTSGVFVISGACLTLVAIGAFRGIEAPHSLAAWLPVLGLAFFSTVVAISALLAAMRYIGASRASLISSVGPPATLIFAALILGEHLGLVQLIGGGLVLSSVVLVNLPGRGVNAAQPISL